MKLNDAHIHLFRRGFPGTYGALFPKGREVLVYEEIRKAHSIDRALVVGYEGDPWARGNNDYLAGLAKNHPWIAPLAYFPATKDLAVTKFQSYWKKGFLGISLYVVTESDVEAVLRWSTRVRDELNHHRAIMSLNCPAELASRLQPLLSTLNATRILLSHLGMPDDIAGSRKSLKPVLQLSELPHVGVKLSGAYACNSYPHPGLSGLVRGLIKAYGTKRLYWGSDFSPALNHVSFAQTIAPFAEMSSSLTSDVLANNLTRVIKRVQCQPSTLAIK